MSTISPYLHHHLWVEVDAEVRSVGEFAEVGLLWLDAGSRRLLGQARILLDPDPAAPFEEPDSPDTPSGGPDGAWGRLLISQQQEGSSPRHLRKRANESGWRWLAGQLEGRPWMTSVKLMLLDGRGFPSKNAGSSLSLWVISHAQSPGWIRLAASLHARTFGDEPHARAQQQLWLAFLRSYADVLNPSYGQIGYNVSGGSTGETVLEDRLPVNFGRNRPQWTVGESRQVLRGYDWLTILSQENADRLGGATELVATGAFFDVASLVNGGVWLRATDDWRDYDRSSAERVFRVVAPVLRRGSPQPPSPSPFPVPAGYEKPYLIVFRDAASVD